MKLKKKLKKIIAILSAVVIAFSCFIVNVSAAGSTGTIYSIPMNQPTADEYSGYIECRYRNTSNGNIIPVVYFWRVYPVMLEVDPEVSTAFEKKPIVYVTVSDTNGVDLNVHIPTYSTDEYQYLNRFYVSYGRILGHSGYIYYGQAYNDDDITNINVDFYLDPGFEIYGFKLYGNGALDSAYSGYQTESIFTFQYSETSVLYESILAMANSLGSSTQQITQNADKNASQIQQNQDDNTNKVINGGTDDPHYTENDKTATDNYHQKEEEIFNGTASARDSTVSMFNNFGNLIESGKLKKGLLVVSRILSQVFAIGWLANLVQFALALGAFSFIIGSVTLVVGKISSNKRAETRSNYYKAKTEYYNSRRKK